jgi:hypothetical protein
VKEQNQLDQFIERYSAVRCVKLQERILSCCKRREDRLCGPVVRVPTYRSRGPGPIPGVPDFHTQPREYN